MRPCNGDDSYGLALAAHLAEARERLSAHLAEAVRKELDDVQCRLAVDFRCAVERALRGQESIELEEMRTEIAELRAELAKGSLRSQAAAEATEESLCTCKPVCDLTAREEERTPENTLELRGVEECVKSPATRSEAARPLKEVAAWRLREAAWQAEPEVGAAEATEKPGDEAGSEPEEESVAYSAHELKAMCSPGLPDQGRGDGRLWIVVGGGDTGGIVVRNGKSLASGRYDSRLTRGTTIEEIEMSGNRLHYKRIRGDGPDWGWVNIMHKEKRLLQLDEEDTGGRS